MNHRSSTLLALTLAATLAGCGETSAPPAAPQASAPPPAPAAPAPVAPRPRVLETFNVGPGVYVRSLAVEPATNALWVGTSSGVHEVDLASRELRNTFTREHGLANEYVFAIGIDRDGRKWFGTNAGGVSRYQDGDWQVYFPMHGLADYWIYSFGEQQDGTWWIGTWAGVNRFDPASGKFTTYVEELVNEWVYAIGVDSKDRVWFGTEGGVSMYDGQQWREWTHNDGMGAGNPQQLPASDNTGLGTRRRHDLGILSGGQATYNPNYVFALHVDPDDSVWVGTWGGGVSHFDGERWHNLTEADGLAGNIVYSIARTPDGAYWFGTHRGLSRYDGTSWQTLGRAEGLLENNVYTLAVGPDGDLWAGTLGGVTRIGLAEPATTNR
ncbi:MAG TPA: two-component regulator propeller domain-containing protein [Gammaproteobacteria bacterium]